jgi:Spy/CpxP family protein refolding chaperone
MHILKFGMMMLLAGVACMAQQPPMPPVQAQPPAVQAPLNQAEIQRLKDIQDKRVRGEGLSPEDQRFAREILVRRPGIARQAALEAMRAQPAAQRAQPAAQRAQAARPLLERALGVPGGRWWTRPEMAQKLGLTADQTKKMDDTLQQFRLKLIDLKASVQKEETIMEPLIGTEQPDEAKIVAQIDKVAQARAELEKTNARMLLGIRRLLTPEQWTKLKAEAPNTAPGVQR